MAIVEVPSPPTTRSRSRRPGRRSIETDLLRTRRLDLDLNAAELQQCQQAAAAAALPLRRWARDLLLGARPQAAHPTDLRLLWTNSSTLQSQANQLVYCLNVLRQSGELRLDTADPTLRELAELAPRLYGLVKQMRVELLSVRGPRK